MTQTATGWTNAVSANGCSGTFTVDKSAPNLFGTSVANCTSGEYTDQPPQFGPVLFWFFTYQPSAAAAATFCFPTISLWDVTAKVDIATGNLTNVIVQRQFDASYSPYASTAGNITGPPLNGRAYNGIEFQLLDNNPFVLARRDAIHLQLPAAVVQLAQADPGGLPAVFSSGKFTSLTAQVYVSVGPLSAGYVEFY